MKTDNTPPRPRGRKARGEILAHAARMIAPEPITCLDDALELADANWKVNPGLRAEFADCSDPQESYRAWVRQEWAKGVQR